MDWYPISGIVLRLMASLGVGFVIAGAVLGYDTNEVAEAFVGLFRELTASDPAITAPSEEVLQQSARTYAALLPAVIPAMWLFAHVLVMHLAAIVTARSGLLARPAEDIAANVRLPSWAIAVPAFGIAGMMLFGSPLYEVCAIAAGIGIAGFALTGLADLHVATRGKPARGIVLFFAWLTLVIFGFPVFIFAAMGVARSLRRTPPNQPPAANSGPGGIAKT